MEMASSEVEMSSRQSFNSVLSPHERCIRGDKNNNNNNNNNKNNVRNIHVAAAFEKNLNVFVRDHLDNGVVHLHDSTKSSVSEPLHQVSDSDPGLQNPGQLDRNLSIKETLAASSLVQIWEARTTQQPSSSSHVDSRTSSSGSNVIESSESLNEEAIKEYESIRPIEEGNNEEEEEEEKECVVPPPPPDQAGEKEREGVRVMDIIRKLSTDSESTSNNDNGSCNNDANKEAQPTEVVRSCFAQVTCPPRIRGRQAFEDLLVQMIRDRDKELASLLGDHRVSNFKYRGRIQSTLRIRCYERCIAIQGRHRCRPSSAGSDLNRSGSGGVMHLLREKYKTSSENTETGSSSGSAPSRGRIPEKDPNKVAEKKVLKETMEKVELKEVIPVVEIAKKVVSSETAKNKTGQTVEKETIRGRGEKQQVKEKTVVRESLEKQETKEKTVAKESLEGRGKKQEIKEKTVVKESLQGVSERRETKERSEGKESVEGKGEKRDIAKEKSVEGNASMGIAEKVNLWKSEEKTYKRRGIDKNDVLEEATRRIVSVESAERRSITTSKEGMMKQCEFAEAMRRKKKEDYVSVDANSKEIEDRNTNPPQEVTTQVSKPASEDKVSKEKTTKSDLKKHVDEKESREGRGDRREMEEKVEENSLMGIAEKVNMWNSKERKNRRSVIEKGKGKTEAKASTESSEVLQEASRRMIDVETAERSISTAKETVEKVVGNTKMMDQRESSREATRCESEEKGRRKQDVEDKSKEIIEVKNMNLQEVIPAEESKEMSTSQRSEGMTILRVQEAKPSKETDRSNFQETIIEEDFASNGSKERAKEKDSSQEQEATSSSRNPNEDEDTKKVELHEEKAEDVQERVIEFVNDWDENVTEEEENEYGDYDLYNGDYTDEWINEIARPQSHWEELRKERYLEVLNTEKQDICDLIHSQPVSMFLTSELRKKIDDMMTTRVKNHLGVKIIQKEEEEDVYEEQEEQEDANEEDGEECSARNQEGNDETEEEAEAEKTDLEEAGDGCSHSSARSSTLMKSWSFRDQDIDKDHEPSISLSLPDPSISTNHSDMQTISDLREQMEKLQQEVLELRNSVKSCIDMQIHFQKFVTQDLSHSGSSREQQVETRRDPLKRKCCVCLEMPVDSLLYRCGHMCTCLKCAHELQWSSKKCPICMAPIVDVVRAFLDA